ncbi:MAG: hypothetical protein JSS09_04770 [Verrucomicrobia bacterium]|nr:hypothetical protein [Verrucomicrobiota bacterium]
MSICPFNCYFTDVQRVLLDPQNQTTEARQQLTAACFAGKAVSALAAGLSGFLGLSNLISCVSYPILGGVGVAFWGTTCLLGLEAFTITQNIENIGSSLPNRIANSASSTIFVNSLFKNTIVVGSIFTKACIEMLNASKK